MLKKVTKTEVTKIQKEQDERDVEKNWADSTSNKFGLKTYLIVERAWAAGFFDGEGSVGLMQKGGVQCCVEQVKRGSKDNPLRDNSASIRGQIVLERFQRAVGGVGKISDVKRKLRGSQQPTCRWRVTNQGDLLKVWNAIGMFLSLEKRDQFADALALPIIAALAAGKPLPDGAVSIDVKKKVSSKGRR